MEKTLDIFPLMPADFGRCGDIWDLKKRPALAKQFYDELCAGNRVIWVCEQSGTLCGEISLVFEANDPEYTIRGRRAYVSRLIVRKDCRRQGIGRALLQHLIEQARQRDLRELTIGVNLDNFPALKLYTTAGFDRVLRVDEDALGRYVKLMKTL